MQTVKADEGNGLKTIEQLMKNTHEGVSCIGIDEMKEKVKKTTSLSYWMSEQRQNMMQLT